MSDSGDEPPRKRSRIERNWPEQRIAKYWFDSGNIVLVADSKKAFKIHGDVLGQRSAVFKDLFSKDVPQPPTQETVEGCPVVDVTDDGETFEIFLDLIYNGWDFRSGDRPPSWKTVKAMILLGDKYQVPEFRQEGVNCLQRKFPSTIAEWDERIGQGFRFRMVTDAFDIVRVTRMLEPDFPDLHAAALYMCCTFPLLVLLQDDVMKSALCADDLRRCMIGRDRLVHAWHKALLEVIDEEPGELSACSDSPICTRARKAMRYAVLKRGDIRGDNYNVAHCLLEQAAWHPTKAMIAKQSFICPQCTAVYETRILNSRQKLRDCLKEMFRLPEDGPFYILYDHSK